MTRTADHDIACLPPAARRALMRQAPQYFRLDARGREAQRARWAAEGSEALDTAVLAEMFGRNTSGISNAASGQDDLSPDEANALNAVLQRLYGVGADFFNFNECLPEGMTCLDYPTLEAYDHADHVFQEAARAEEIPGHVSRPYHGRLAGEWARLIENDRLVYAILSDLGGFVSFELDTEVTRLLDVHVPHTYRRGEKNGAPGPGGTRRLDIRLDADGYESLYHALSRKARDLAADRVEALRRAAHADAETTIWRIDAIDWYGAEEAEGNDATYFVFASPAAMAATRPRHFLADCAAHAGTTRDLRDRVAREISGLRADVEAELPALRTAHPRGLAPLTPRKPIYAACQSFDLLDADPE